MKRTILSTFVACALVLPNIAAAQNVRSMRDGTVEPILLAAGGEISDKSIMARHKCKVDGAVGGAIVGTLIFPVVGTAIGFVVGGIIGMVGDNFTVLLQQPGGIRYITCLLREGV